MPTRKKQSKPSSESADQPSFEEALESLEQLVEKMEGDDLPLEEMIVGYEQGVKLRGICERRLEEAQAKVELIRDEGGAEVEVENFDADDDDEGKDVDAADEDAESVTSGDDGELF